MQGMEIGLLCTLDMCPRKWTHPNLQYPHGASMPFQNTDSAYCCQTSCAGRNYHIKPSYAYLHSPDNDKEKDMRH